jgi:hypothetical protein
MKPIAEEDLSKFTALVKRQGDARLTASDAARLDKHVYADYISKIKYYAREKH